MPIPKLKRLYPKYPKLSAYTLTNTQSNNFELAKIIMFRYQNEKLLLCLIEIDANKNIIILKWTILLKLENCNFIIYTNNE